MATRPIPVLHVYNGSTYDQYNVLKSIVVERGQQTLLERVGTATATFVLDDMDGYLDPAAPATIGYGPDTFVYLRIADSTATSRTHFAGRVQSYRVSYPGDDFARIEMSCVGTFDKLSQVAFNDAYFAGVGSTAVSTLLDSMVADGIGGGASLGTWVLQNDGTGGTQVGVNAAGTLLGACQAVTEAVDGHFMEEMWNDVSHPAYRFVARSRRFGASRATFTDVNPSPPTSYPYREPVPSEASKDLIRNTITVSANGLADQTATDATSVASHGIIEHTITSWHDDVAGALVRAQDALVAFKEPAPVNVKMITLEPDAEDDTDLWDLVCKLGVESSGCLKLFHRVTLVRTTPFTTSTRQMILTGFRQNINPLADGGWTVDLYLADAELTKDSLILDDATAGKLDTGRLG